MLLVLPLLALGTGVALAGVPLSAGVDLPDLSPVRGDLAHFGAGLTRIQDKPDVPKPDAPDVDAPDLNVKVDSGSDTVWYANPLWIAVGAIVVLLVIVLIVLAARGGGTTVVRD